MIVLADTGGTFTGAIPTCILERTGMTFDKPDVVKTIRSIVPRIDAAPGTVLSIQVGGSMDAEVAPVYSAAATYTVGTTRKADAFASGRYLAVKITSTSTQPWRLKSYDADIFEHGPY